MSIQPGGKPIEDVSAPRGLWRRSLIAWPDGERDTTIDVRWLQGLRALRAIAP